MRNRVAETGLSALVLKSHRGIWREDAEPLDLSRDEVLELLPVLLNTGSAGLVWPRLRAGTSRYGAAEHMLERAYRSQLDHNRLVEERLVEATVRLARESITPMIIKGWSLSRRYPAGLLRSAGDIDLVVAGGDYDRALDAMVAWARDTGEINLELHRSDRRAAGSHFPRREGVRRVDIDLHRDSQWDSMPADDALRRARRVRLMDDLEIGVLCPEDELRQVCIHFLWHGATRLLRLVDIALLLETRPEDFDWERFLGQDPKRRSWMLAALGLAHHLLDARIDDTPVTDQACALPGWLLPVAIRQVQQNQPPLGAAWGELSRNPRELGAVLRRRWPDPISATTHLPAGFTGLPRLPIQWLVFLRRMGEYTVLRWPDQATRGGPH